MLKNTKNFHDFTNKSKILKNDIAYIINIMPREGSGFDPSIVPDFDLLL